MGNHGCTADGSLNDENFTGPLPVIGVYIAAASLVCFLAMALDMFYGIRGRKPWFPCRFFPLNATSLTLLSIATKFPVDLNTAMPSPADQLSKLSGTVLICTVMANFMPSLGTMSESELLSNIVAVGMLVITVIVNVCIQLGTGVIYVFLPEHAIVMFFMLVLLALLFFSALTVPTTRKILNDQHDEKWQNSSGVILDEPSNCGREGFEFMKKVVEESWMMAYSSSNHHVLRSSETCNAAGAFSLLGALVLVEATIRSLVIPGYMRFCIGKSDYGWSTWVVFISQALAVLVGSVGPVLRWLNAINFKIENWGSREVFRVDKYWIQRLIEWKRSPFPFYISCRLGRVIAYRLKNKIMDGLIGIEKVVVWASKLIRLIPILLVDRLKKFLISSCFPSKKLPTRLESQASALGSSDPVDQIEENQHYNPSYFVLHLDGEEDLVQLILRTGIKDTEKWISRGEKNIPNHLITLLEKKSSASHGFKGVLEFDRDEIVSILVQEEQEDFFYNATREGKEEISKKPPNCWALPVVTLTSIAVLVLLAHPDKERMNLLLQGVRQGLKFVSFIERRLGASGLINTRKAAEDVWLSIDLYNHWLDVNLRDLASSCNPLQSSSPVEIIRKLPEIAERGVLKFKETIKDELPHKWPVKVVAANSLYRICKTILLDHEKYQTMEKLIDWLEQTISDLLGDCLINLPRAVFRECSYVPPEEREGRVRNAGYILGEAQHLQEILRLAACEGSSLYAGSWVCAKCRKNPWSSTSQETFFS